MAGKCLSHFKSNTLNIFVSDLGSLHISDMCLPCKEVISRLPSLKVLNHSLSYDEMMESSTFCRFCRFLVCALSKRKGLIPEEVYTKFESHAVDTISWLRNRHLGDFAAKSQQRNDFPTDTGGLEVKLVVPQDRQKQRLEDSFTKSQQQEELPPPLKERYNTMAGGNTPLHSNDVHSGGWESMKLINIQTPSTSSFEGTPIRVPEYQSLKSRSFRGRQEQSSSTDSRYDPVLPTLGTVLAVWFANNHPSESDYYRISRPRGH
jgi:hypothetical protein